jgi:nucleoside-diphosphate-sugar epimerase
MRILIFGGTSFLSQAVAAAAVERDHDVVCAARGTSGEVPEGAKLVTVDRDGGTAALEPLAGTDYDAVLDVSFFDPAWVRDALEALGGRTGHWTFVSSQGVYADQVTPGQTADTAPLMAPMYERPTEITPDVHGGTKVAGERMVAELFDGPTFIVRPGLVVGPGDLSDQFGYWPARLARGGEVLVAEPLDAPIQLIDVRDLSTWIIEAAERRLTGTFDAVCSPVPLSQVLTEIATAVDAPDHTLVPVTSEFLLGQGVLPWYGPRSLPLWLPGATGFMTRDVTASYAAGLRTRGIGEIAADVHAFDRARGEREPVAGLSAEQEAELLAAR